MLAHRPFLQRIFPRVGRALRAAVVACLVISASATALAEPPGMGGKGPTEDGLPKSLPAAAIFQRASPSVFVVRARSASDASVASQGSAVALEPELLATNFHVVRGSRMIEVVRNDQSSRATLVAFDEKRDLALLEVKGLGARPARIRRAPEIAVGEQVYAIGSPRGLELTFSDGLVSALRDVEGGQVIQTTAPISPGSSGGGLFDASGQLIGLTTFTAKDSQNLNFAHPIAWLDALRATPSLTPGDAAAAAAAPVWDIGHRPPELECAIDRDQVWAFFPSGDEILESKPTKDTYAFQKFGTQTPSVTPGDDKLVLVNLDRRRGWLWFMPGPSSKAYGKGEFYLFDVVGSDFQLTRFIPKVFHGQPRYRALAGSCRAVVREKPVVRGEPAVATLSAGSSRPKTCIEGAADRCVAEADALPPERTAVRVTLLRRGCELGDTASCERGTEVADKAGLKSIAAELRIRSKRHDEEGTALEPQ
jgi:hypothetical protein